MIRLHYSDDGLLGRLTKWASTMRRRIGSGALLRALMRVHAEQTRKRFKTKTTPDGEDWDEWSPAYAATRRRRHSLLKDTRALFRSLGNSAIKRDGADVTYAPRGIDYAEAVNKKREFMGVGERDLDELDEALHELWHTEAARNGLA